MLKLVRRARSRFWYMRGTIQKLRIFESTGESERRKAEIVKQERTKEIFERRIFGAEVTTTFSEIANSYMDATGQARFLLPLINHFKTAQAGEINQAAADHAAAILYPGRASATLARQVYTPIIAILNHGASLEMCAKPAVKKCRVIRRPIEAASDSYITRILPHCRPNLYAWILCATFTGARVAELCRLEPRDFDLTEGFVYFSRTKNGEPRTAVLPPQAIAAVANILPERGRVFGFDSRQGVNHALERAAKRAGVPFLSSHKIGRHAFAARLLAAGRTLAEVKAAGGWKSLAVVDSNYGHLERSHINEIVLNAAKKGPK